MPMEASNSPSGRHAAAWIAQWTERRRRAARPVLGGLLLVSHCTLLWLWSLVGSKALAKLSVGAATGQQLVMMHAFGLVLAALGLVSLWWSARPRIQQVGGELAMTLSLWLPTLGYALLLTAAARYDAAAESSPVLGILSYHVALAILLHPGGWLGMVALVGATTAIAMASPASMPGGPFAAVSLGLGGLLLAAVRIAGDLSRQSAAQREWQLRSLSTPMQAVHRALDLEVLPEVDAAFGAARRFCVCIATDWRDYRTVGDRLSASQLSMSLSEYLDLCERILARCLPAGHYYADWIADELLVVLYADGEAPDPTLVDAATRFAVELIEARAGFARVHALPATIDVGLAAGGLVLGMMGPEGRRKATALGGAPARARHLQGAGKLLRRKRGDRDRIIFGPECLPPAEQQATLGVATLPLSEHEAVRDAPDRTLYFVEADLRGTPPGRREAA